MNITNITTTPVTVDPVNFRKESKYTLYGLTVQSNNPGVINRDDRGNITYYESGSDNQILVVETVHKEIQKRSFLSAVDTHFEYFSFPATVVPTTLSVNLDISLILDQDLIYSRYKPSDNTAINSGSVPAGILLDTVAEGNPQIKTNAYTVTKEIKNTGKDLRIRAKVQHNFKGGEAGTAYFYVMKNGVDQEQIDRTWKGPFNDPASIKEVGGQIVSGIISFDEIQTVLIDFVVPNVNISIGDSYTIGAVAGQAGHEIFAEQTYFVVTDASKNVDTWNQPNSLVQNQTSTDI